MWRRNHYFNNIQSSVLLGKFYGIPNVIIRKLIMSYRCLILLGLLFSTMRISAQSSADIQSYISQYQQIALEQEQLYGIPAPITLAQGILESNAGKSMLSLKANNHFGIKAFAISKSQE